MPTDDHSGVRVRLLFLAEKGGVANGNEVALTLEISPQPNLRSWQRVGPVTVRKATDDQGQNLEQSADDPVPAGIGPGAAGGAMAVGAGLVRGVSVTNGDPSAQVDVTRIHLKAAPKPSKSLREISGTITASVLAKPQIIIAADNVLESIGKTVTRAEGGSIKVLDVSNEENLTKIHFQIDPPRESGLGEGTIGLSSQAGAIRMVRSGAAGADFPVGELTLLDDKGNLLPPWGMQFHSLAATLDFVVTYQPQKSGGKPARLVYSTSKNVTINVPFTLKDVPLP